MNAKKIRIGILIIVAIIILIIVFFLLFAKKNKKESDIVDSYEEEDIQYHSTEVAPVSDGTPYKGKQIIDSVKEENTYFNIKSIVENYYNQLSGMTDGSNIIIPRSLWEANENAKKKYVDEQKKDRQLASQKNLYNIYGKEYKKEFNIKENSIKFDIKESEYTKNIIGNMYEADILNSTTVYVVSGKRVNTKDKNYKDFCTIVVVDYGSMSFSVYPEEYVTKHNYNKLKIGDKIDINIEAIEQNEYNAFDTETFDDVSVCKEYMENLRDRIIYGTDDLYDALDKEYKEARFNNNKNKYEEYLKNNKGRFSKVELKKYIVQEKGEYKYYICIDNYNNQYKFKRNNGILNYTIFLDNYSVIDSIEKNHYNGLNKNNKASYQLTKFIRQINTSDYENIYNHLNNEYKDTNFRDINEMKKYISTNFYNINGVDILNNEEQPDYNVLQCKLTNLEDTNQNKKMYVIIKTGEDMNYTMSFSFE